MMHNRAFGILRLVCLAAATPAAAQPAMERLTFDEAIRRAVTSHPTVERAAADILRAEAILQQVRSASLPTAAASVTSTTIGPVPEFGGETIVPRTQVNAGASLAVPLFAPVRWAERAQAQDSVVVTQRGADDVRRQIAVATAEAYLAVIAARRVLESNEVARDNARAHYEYARQRYEGGVGSRLNALRAQQELSGDEARVETVAFAVRRAQEALGVLVAADGPADAGAEPAFAIPAELTEAAAATGPAAAQPGTPTGWLLDRSDLRLLSARVSAAERVAADSWKDYLPQVSGVVTPQLLAPSGLFAQAHSWSAAVLFAVPVFDGGERGGRERERRALVDAVRAERRETERQALSELRTAVEAVRSSERALASIRAAAEQADEVLRITDIAFREGASTNIEVVDAQRRARDAATAAAVAEDAVRRARLDVLVAAGRFPG
jgi:outer membrane protein TolC